MSEQARPHGNVETPGPPKRGFTQGGRFRLGAVVALAVAAGFAAWLLVSTRDNSSTVTPTTTVPAGITDTAKPVGPVAVSQSKLSTLVGTLNHPIYWAGPRAGYTYELTETTSGNVYVRYLPAGVNVGDKRASFLIIATYPFPNAFAALKKVSKGKEIPLSGGGIAAVDTSYPKSVHLAFPNADYQIEVYDPSPKRALRVAVSSDLQPIG